MLKLYNTLSRKKEIFKPRENKKVNLFVCGPTTYDFSHVGHARTYIVFDALVKYLKQKGYKIFYLQNITDIDDKIIARARERKIHWLKLSHFFEKEYLKDIRALKIKSITKYAKATAHIKEIINQISRLLKKNYAYYTKDGIYYDILKFKDYGKLSKRTILQAEDSVSRIDETIGKKNKGDFCLWKFSKADEPKWKSPFGWGRPGWHIEDTAITEKYFGYQYDIHGGARDLIFPHHEAEIAQMEAISGKKPLARYWLHTGFLTVGGQKMAKSLGNFITIRDFLKNYSFRILRLFVLKTHYRSPVDYTEKAILQTKKELEKIDDFIAKLKSKNLKRGAAIQNLKVSKFQKFFEVAMENDFNTAKAIAVIFDLVSKGNSLFSQGKLTKNDSLEILKFLKEVDKILEFIFEKKPKEKIPLKVLKLVRQREKYRKIKKWEKADEIREQIKKMGYWTEDTKEGPKLKKL